MSVKRPVLKFVGKARELMHLNSYVSLEDNNIATIDGCNKILECADVLVRVVTGKFEVEIWGNDLMLTIFSEGNAQIRGKIDEIKLKQLSLSGYIDKENQ